MIPDDLKDIEKEIEDWLEYKKEKKQSYKPKGLEYLWIRLRAIDPEHRKEAITFSMSNNYSGIWESPKKREGGQIEREGSDYIPGKYTEKNNS